MKQHVKKILATLVLAGTWPLFAQTPAPAPATQKPATTTEPETIALSPFEVSASSDVGYQATSTLAGTRIRTDLQDVGSAISVATKEFMRDLGATDNQSLLQYMVSAEVGGANGNFAGLGDGAVLDDTTARLRPNQNTRIRGLDTADNTRDFYGTDIPWDSFNTSRIDLQRGANSILFGNGSGAGIINGTPDAAEFGRNFGTAEIKYRKLGGVRGSLNFNEELIHNELALRVATVFDKTYYRQDPAYNRDKRIYGAVRYEPSFLKVNGMRTSFRASYENGDIDANRPRSNTPGDGFSPWFLTAPKEMRSPTPIAGRSATNNPDGGDNTLLGVLRPMISHAGYDPFVTAITDAGLIAANPTRLDIGARAALGTTNAATSEGWLGRGTSPGIAGWQNGGFAAFFSDPTSGTMSGYIPQAPGATLFNAIGSTGARDGTIAGLRGVDNAAIVRLDQYTILGVGGRVTANDGFLYERQGVYKGTTVTDPSIFNFYNKLLDGPNKKEASNFHAFNFQFEQTFFNDKAGFQIADDKQIYKEYQRNFLGSDSIIAMDVYKYLPVASVDANGNLQPVLNPNFGRMFVASTPGGRRTKSDRDTLRITPFADLNFPELLKSDNMLTKVLGHHTVTGLYERNKYFQQSDNFTRYALDPNSAFALAGPNQTVGARRLAVVTYLGPSLATATSASGANLSNITGTQNVVTGPATYFDATYSAAAPAAVTPYTQQPGLLPNQTGTSSTAAQTASENPVNYNGWSTKPITIVNAQNGNEADLTTSWNERRDVTKSRAIVDQWSLLDHTLVLTGGLRRDKIDTFRPGDPAANPSTYTGNRVVPGSTGAVDFGAPYAYSSTPTSSFESETLKTWSIVAHSPAFINRHLPLGMTLTGFYNHSENFRPLSRAGVLGEPIAPPTGRTKDYGVLITAFNGRVSLKVNRYDSFVTNATLTDNSVISFTGDEFSRSIQFAKAVQNHAGSLGASTNGNYAFRNTADATDTNFYAYQPAVGSSATWTTAMFQAAEVQAQLQAKTVLDADLAQTKFLSAWQINPNSWTYNGGSTFGITSVTLAGLAVTGDTHSSGTEYELFLRPMDNWNISMNLAHTHAQRLNLAGTLANWLQSRWDLYAGPAGDLRWFGGGGGGSTNPNAAPGDPLSDFGRVRFGRNGWRFFNSFKALEGADAPELRPWRFSVTTNYTFNGHFGGEKLKGIFIGGSFRWEDKNIIGFAVKESTPALGSVNPALGADDITKPFYGPTDQHIDLFAGYSHKIMKNINWRLQANVRNVAEKDRLIPITSNPDGSGAAYRIAYGPSWELSSRFEF